MNRLFRICVSGCCGLLLAVAALVGSPALATEKIITVGTAGVTGVYYPAGGAICRLVNRLRREHGLRCVVESTGGSISNLESMRGGDLDLSIVQSDWLYHAYQGSEVFNDVGADPSLRVVSALHSEPFTILVRKESAINDFNGLKGKRVYMGNRGSGMRATMKELIKIAGWKEDSLVNVTNIDRKNFSKALCNGDVDAVIYAAGHPNGAVQQVTNVCDVRIVGVSAQIVDKLIEHYPFYAHTVIPGGMYLGNPYSIKTFGVEAVLVASDSLDEEVVYEFAKAVFGNLDNFKTLHPVFATLDASRMMYDAEGIAPVHKGSKRYFEEWKTKAMPKAMPTASQ